MLGPAGQLVSMIQSTVMISRAQTRITDHRASVTLHRLDAVMEGELDELLDAVHLYMAAEAEKEALGS